MRLALFLLSTLCAAFETDGSSTARLRNDRLLDTCRCCPQNPNPPEGCGQGCFSATSTVRVLGQGPVQMQDLKVGDEVLTGSPDNYKYQPIFAFGHLNQEALSDFYAITTKGSKVPLEMTGEHLVYLDGKSNPVRADSLQVGDALLGMKGPSEISAIKKVTKHGLYNPLTADGHLVVNDIAVSTYIALQESNHEHYQIGQGNYKFNLVSHQKFVHLYLTPFRMLCMGVSSQLCQVSDEEGIPYYISQGMKLVQWVVAQNVMVQLIFFLITVPIFVALLVLEMMVGSSAAPFAILALVLISKKAPMFTVMKKQKSA